MKIIKQISTDLIVYRESPHTDKSIRNVSIYTGIPESDLEVVDENLTEEEWNNALHNQLGYSDRRATEYPPMSDQLDMLWHAMDTGILPKVDSFYDINKSIKDKYPKE
jgi:hypothetical protein